MSKDLRKLSLPELCDELVVSTEKLLKAMQKKDGGNIIWQLKAEVKEIQLAIREKSGKSSALKKQ